MLRTQSLGRFVSKIVKARVIQSLPPVLSRNSPNKNALAVIITRRFVDTPTTAFGRNRDDEKDRRRAPTQLTKYSSIKELEVETKYLISLIKQSSTSSSAGNKRLLNATKKNDKPGFISMDHLSKNLEAWMEACLEGHGIYAAQHALSVLETMEANFDQTTSAFYTPSTSFYDIVFHAFASCRGRREAAETVQSVLQRMLERAKKSRRYYPQPTTKTFNIALNCWAKSNEYDAGLRAEELWHVMSEWHENYRHEMNRGRPVQCSPNERTMAALVEAWGNSGHEDTPDRVLYLLQHAIDQQKTQAPLVNAIVFSNAIRAVTRHNHPLGAEKAEEILRLMQQSHVQPNTRTYAAVLHAYTSAAESNQMRISKPDSAKRATAILYQMIQNYREGAAGVKPNVYCFTTCIAAWARCQDGDGNELNPQECAEGLWGDLVQLYLETSDPAFRPSVETGNAVLMAWMRATHVADAMDRGDDVLKRMRQFTKPDLRSYNILLNGMNWRGMGEQALKLIEWMERQGPELRPDRFSFNSVLAALAKDRTLPHAQEKAEVVLRRMEFSSVGADHFSYATVLDAWARSEDTTDKARRAEALAQVMMDRYHAFLASAIDTKTTTPADPALFVPWDL
ncbi:hypothetical protein FisN_6Hh021 [Fistulifera solaris]|uniref:Pentacotripeptide-repeat region of PRORP domain-containing protein n=1 Tax=Fistulifera solaris TaxID=1519565 RepID=A0A1Z5KI55_FISSO|nr:hypothetical protein FisN_6Hh021 [Fistulifera solaris]|eukprot:GAX25939.1 hypothetical protein FisN_6Hh021 [Fistulifera solaris]